VTGSYCTRGWRKEASGPSLWLGVNEWQVKKREREALRGEILRFACLLQAGSG